MIRSFIILILTLSFSQIHAQDDIVEQIVNTRTLLSDPTKYNPPKALKQLELIESQCITSSNDTLKAVFWSLKGQACYFMERYEESIPMCKSAIQLFERSDLRQYEYLDAFRIIANSYYVLKDYENAERFYRKGLLRSVAAKVSTTDQYRADIYKNIANLYQAKGDTIIAAECIIRSKQLNLENLPINKTTSK